MNNFISPQAERSIYHVIIITFILCFLVNKFQPATVSPLSDVYAYTPVSSPTQTPEPTTENIVAYIAKVFEPEGTAIVVKAIDCFYSESGLRTDAYNFNAWNSTDDRGIAQINSIHGMKPEDAHNPWKNIDKAHQIYKSRGNFSAWYGRGCK